MAERMLDIYRNDELVGILVNEVPLKFRYADAWLQKPGAEPIAPNISLQQQEHAGEYLHAYFENLLPEGDVRQFLSISQHATTIFGLLSAVGGDTASGLNILPHNEKPALAEYYPTTWTAIAQSLHHPNAASLITQNKAASRISLAGAQEKILLIILPNGMPAIPLGSTPSTHILKPNITRLTNIWASALNETFVMQLAASVDLGVAPIEYQPVAKASLIKRYDRFIDPSGKVKRLHQFDLCQLDGKTSNIKYESDGGPTLARCCELLRQNNVPAVDLKRLLAWVFFNLYVGNNDSHAKNLSILHIPQEGMRLAPFYDLMSLTLYSGLSKQFAFKIGGENKPANLQIGHIHAMAQQLSFRSKYVMNIAEELAHVILANLHPVATNLALNLATQSGTEYTLLEKLEQKITSNINKLIQRWF